MNKNSQAYLTKLCLEQYEASTTSTKEVDRMKKENNLIQENNDIRNTIFENQNRGNKKSAFCCKLKHSLVFECVKSLLDQSTTNVIETSMTRTIKTDLINQFIKEEGTDNLINRFAETSYLLSEYSNIINKNYNLCLEKAQKEDEFDCVDCGDEFINSLKFEDAEDVADVIRTRVNNDIDTFITNGINDRAKIKDALQVTQEKISKIDQTSPDAEKIEESVELQGKMQVRNIRNNRARTIFETMIFNVCENTLKNPKMKELYFKDNSFDMETIKENCTVIYSFLEMLNTAKMKNITPEYIQETLNSLK